MTASVETRNLTHRFGKFEALKQIGLVIEAGQYAVLLGPSGCGKTTLLSVLGGFLKPAVGQVLINGNDVTQVTPANRPTTTMFQDYALFPHMTLLKNVAFGLRMKGMDRSSRNNLAQQMLEVVGMPNQFAKKPHEISGGQRQRVALARALAVEPDVLLLDEPLGALDLKLRRQMQEELKEIQRRLGTTFIHVTHDQEEAMAIADQIIVMNDGEIADAGSPDRVYLRPPSRFCANFMGETNLLAAVVEQISTQRLLLQTAIGQVSMVRTASTPVEIRPDDHVDLCFRPEQVRIKENSATVATTDPSLSNSDDPISLGMATIVDSTFSGAFRRCQVQPFHANIYSDNSAGEVSNSTKPQLDLLTVNLPQNSSLVVGATVSMSIAVQDLVILTQKTSEKGISND